MSVLATVAEKHSRTVPELLSRTRKWSAAREEAVTAVRMVVPNWTSEDVAWIFSREGATMREHTRRDRRRTARQEAKNGREPEDSSNSG